MPPMRGSTRRSRTSRPRRPPMTSATDGSSVNGERGSTTSSPARARPAGPTTPDRARANGFRGTPRASPSGNGRSRPRLHSHALVVAGATRSSPKPRRRHRSAAQGTRPRKVSGPTSRGSSPKVSVRTLPPTRSNASSTVTGTPASRRNHAVASPVMPAPTTVTRSGDIGVEHLAGQRVAEDGVVVERLGAGEGDAELLGALAGLDVEVVEDLQMVGDEPGRAHEHARCA